jgi:hypothetical protein
VNNFVAANAARDSDGHSSASFYPSTGFPALVGQVCERPVVATTLSLPTAQPLRARAGLTLNDYCRGRLYIAARLFYIGVAGSSLREANNQTVNPRKPMAACPYDLIRGRGNVAGMKWLRSLMVARRQSDLL